MSNWAFYERHFGAARLRHYLAETAGDTSKATELYRWNVAISGAFWESLAYFEVALRNTLDEQMTHRHRKLGRAGHWVFDDALELGRRPDGGHRQPYRDVHEAIRRVRHNRKPVDAGQVISELPFGFWHQLVSRRQQFLWPDLASEFPYAPSRAPRHVHDPIARLRAVRNRVGHHHRIWSEDLLASFAGLLDVSGFIDPDLRRFIEVHSRVPGLSHRRPTPI